MDENLPVWLLVLVMRSLRTRVNSKEIIKLITSSKNYVKKQKILRLVNKKKIFKYKKN